MSVQFLLIFIWVILVHQGKLNEDEKCIPGNYEINFILFQLTFSHITKMFIITGLMSKIIYVRVIQSFTQ